MNIGYGSISLKVENLEASIKFYNTLGFKQIGGNVEHRYVVLQSPSTTISLFEGMLETNMLTFNPKWDRNCEETDTDDVRDIHSHLVAQGYTPGDLGSDATEGPNHFTIKDPDGNVILVDQHI